MFDYYFTSQITQQDNYYEEGMIKSTNARILRFLLCLVLLTLVIIPRLISVDLQTHAPNLFAICGFTIVVISILMTALFERKHLVAKVNHDTILISYRSHVSIQRSFDLDLKKMELLFKYSVQLSDDSHIPLPRLYTTIPDPVHLDQTPLSYTPFALFLEKHMDRVHHPEHSLKFENTDEENEESPAVQTIKSIAEA